MHPRRGRQCSCGFPGSFQAGELKELFVLALPGLYRSVQTQLQAWPVATGAAAVGPDSCPPHTSLQPANPISEAPNCSNPCW